VYQVGEQTSQRTIDGKLTSSVYNRAGKALHAFRDDFKNSQQELKDQMLIAAALWGRVKPQLLVLRRTAPSLGEEYLNLQIEMLERLERKINDLTTKSEKLLTMPSFQKYVDDASRSAAPSERKLVRNLKTKDD